MIIINTKPTITTIIIQISMSTKVNDNNEIKQAYNKINKVLSMTKVGEKFIILGDWNVSAEEQSNGYIIIGKYSLG